MELSRRKFLALLGLGGLGIGLAACAPSPPPSVLPPTPARELKTGIATPTIPGKFGQVNTIEVSPDRTQFWHEVYQKAASYFSYPTGGVDIVEIAPGQNIKTTDGYPVTSLLIPSPNQGEKSKIAILKNPRWFADEAFARDNNATLDQVAKATEAAGIVEELVHACTPDFTGDPFTQEPFIVYIDTKTYIDGPTGKPYRGTIRIYLRQKLDMALKLNKQYQDGTVDERKFSEVGNTEELIAGWVARKIVNEIFGSTSLEAKISSQIRYYLPGVRVIDNLFQATHADLGTVLKAKQARDMKTIFEMLSDGLVAVGEADGIKTASSKKNDPVSQYMLYNVVTKLSAPGTEKEIPSQALNSIFSDLSQFYYGKEFVILNNEEQQKIIAVMNSLLKDSTKKISSIPLTYTFFNISGNEL